MSKHILLKTALTSVLGIIVGYGVTQHTQQQIFAQKNVTHRFLASTPLTKLGVDQVSYDYFNVSIDNKSLSESSNESSVVSVKITALKNIPVQLSYQWLLGREVITTDGLTGIITPMAAGEEKVFEIRLQNYSKEFLSHVSFIITGALGQHSVNRETLISSRPEDSFEYLVQKNEMRVNLNEHNIQKLSTGENINKKFHPSKIIR
ncbi:MAG: hypothetical protein ACK41T_03350 [Pseudobdellovibrio sp.]